MRFGSGEGGGRCVGVERVTMGGGGLELTERSRV